MASGFLLMCTLIFLVYMSYMGSRKGVIRLVYNIAALILSMVLSQCLAAAVTGFISQNTSLYETVREQTDKYVQDNIRSELAEAAAGSSAADVLSLPKVVSDVLYDSDSAGGEAEKILNSDIASVGADKVCGYISEVLAAIVTKALISIIIFVIVIIAINVLGNAMNILYYIPGINTLNKAAGAIVGFAQGLIIIWIVCIVIMMFAGTEAGNTLYSAIDGNKVLSFIYDTNLFAKLFKNTLDVSALS